MTADRLPGAIARAAPRLAAIGASAGGFEALLSIMAGLRADSRLAMAVVLHMPQDHGSLLAELFAARLPIPVKEAQARLRAQPGTLYFAPAGYHLLVERDGTFGLSCDPPVHFSRPSIDVLFDSCADALGAGAAGILLTGANEDGAEGLASIRAAGGITIVQDPATAAWSAMPDAALALGRPDAVLALEGIARVLELWSGQSNGQ
jgi:two-component system chemotaxis response regulator CheB